VSRSPADARPFLEQLLSEALRYIKYDPNYGELPRPLPASCQPKSVPNVYLTLCEHTISLYLLLFAATAVVKSLLVRPQLL
jgi:hypothetical protein